MGYQVQILADKVRITQHVPLLRFRTWEWPIATVTVDRRRHAALCLEMALNGFVGPMTLHFQYSREALAALQKQQEKYIGVDHTTLMIDIPRRNLWQKLLGFLKGLK